MEQHNYIHILLTCTFTLILIFRAVFRKTYNVKDGIEQGLLKQNLAFMNVLEHVKQKFYSVFISTVHCLRHKKGNLRNKKGNSGQKVKN